MGAPTPNNAAPAPIASKRRTGRIQTLVRRALIIADRALSTRELIRYCYGEPPRFWHYQRVREAAREFAVEIGRQRSAGAPVVWRLKGQDN